MIEVQNNLESIIAAKCTLQPFSSRPGAALFPGTCSPLRNASRYPYHNRDHSVQIFVHIAYTSKPGEGHCWIGQLYTCVNRPCDVWMSLKLEKNFSRKFPPFHRLFSISVIKMKHDAHSETKNWKLWGKCTPEKSFAFWRLFSAVIYRLSKTTLILWT